MNSAVVNFASDNSFMIIRNYYNPSTNTPTLVNPADDAIGLSNFNYRFDSNLTLYLEKKILLFLIFS